MDPSEIKVGRYYKLSSGQTVRVQNICNSLVRCDALDEETGRWIHLHSPLPALVFSKSCNCPTCETEKQT